MECGATPSIFVDETFLHEMGIYEEVNAMLKTSGWKELLSFACKNHTVLSLEFLTMEKMRKMRGITISKEKKALWCYEGFAEAQRHAQAVVQEGLVQADQTGLQGCAPARQRTRAQQCTHATPQPVMSALQPTAPVEHPWMDPQVMRRWIFSVDRVMEYHAPKNAFMNMAPPPEWMSGMPIPLGYCMREETSDEVATMT